MENTQSLVINATVYLENAVGYQYATTVDVASGELAKVLDNAKQKGIILRGIDYSAPIFDNTDHKVVRALASELKDQDVKSIEDLYWFVYEYADSDWVRDAVYNGIPRVYVFNDEEVVNYLLDGKSPWEIIHSISNQFNDSDDYVYWTSDNLLQTMNNDQFEKMLQDNLSTLLVEFCKLSDIPDEIIDTDCVF